MIPSFRFVPSALTLVLSGLAALSAQTATPATPTPTAAAPAAPQVFDNCPMIGWPELLPNYLKPATAFPTQDTPLNAPDCAFHQWSWEAFTWATALDAHGVPRFLTLHTPEDLFKPDTPPSDSSKPRQLTLGTRAAHGFGNHVEGIGAITEADGNMLVAPNGYPVYASVHMNDSYFATAKRNLIVTGGYQNNADADHFDVGAAVFKAMWLRLDEGQLPPPGAYTTKATVPLLTTFLTADNTLYVTPSGRTTTVTVALVGLHVVGHTINHPEFLWGTFEHKNNSPRFADGTFNPASTASDPRNFTLYQGGTPYNQTNPPSTQTTATSTSTSSPLSTPSTTITTTTTLTATPTYTFDPATQKFSPSTNAVLANRTGGETFSPDGPAHIAHLNESAHTFFAGLPAPQSTFGSYDLIGTVWMTAGTYNLNSNQSNAVGSVNLANVTAETFVQNLAGTTTPATVQNCFSCHNPDTFQNVAPMPNLPARRIALSHVLAAGSLYAVPNMLSVKLPASAATTFAPPVR